MRGYIGMNKGYVWLPRQDQLQAMVEKEPMDCLDGVKGFWIEIGCPDCSWEQLWLAFVMDGKEWVHALQG